MPTLAVQSPGDESPSALAYVPGGGGKTLVQSRPLDDVLKELYIRPVTLMKLDVKGAEIKLLQGASGALKNSRPIVIFEVDLEAARLMGESAGGTWELLAGLHYAFFRFSDGVATPLREFPHLQRGTFHNIIAVPEGYARR